MKQFPQEYFQEIVAKNPNKDPQDLLAAVLFIYELERLSLKRCVEWLTDREKKSLNNVAQYISLYEKTFYLKKINDFITMVDKSIPSLRENSYYRECNDARQKEIRIKTIWEEQTSIKKIIRDWR